MKALVTRPVEDAAPLLRALETRGIETIVAPLLTIVPDPEAGRRLTDALIGAQAVLFTSANGARHFAAASVRRELPAFAVGDASAAAARLAGFRSVANAGGDVEDLARLVAARLAPHSGALVHVAGGEVAGDLAGELAAQGFSVRRAVVYAAVAAEALAPDAATALAAGEITLALFFSPRTAAGFVRLAAAAGIAESCGGVTALALSPAVAAALATLPWQAVRVAEAPTQQALLAVLDAVVAEHERNMGAA